jgi:hypothetical protein
MSELEKDVKEIHLAVQQLPFLRESLDDLHMKVDRKFEEINRRVTPLEVESGICKNHRKNIIKILFIALGLVLAAASAVFALVIPNTKARAVVMPSDTGADARKLHD